MVNYDDLFVDNFIVCKFPDVPFCQLIDASMTNLGAAVDKSTSTTSSQLKRSIVDKNNSNLIYLIL